jgi:hypothetical protein
MPEVIVDDSGCEPQLLVVDWMLFGILAPLIGVGAAWSYSFGRER